jgi:hypothetical protein
VTPPDTGSDRPLLDKLGVRPGMRVSVLGSFDPGFVEELRERGADVSARHRTRSDLVFVRLPEALPLVRLASLEPSLQRNGAVWVIYARGRPDLRETDVIRAGLAAGLVDNKIVRFSDTHTGMRLVIPVSRR